MKAQARLVRVPVLVASALVMVPGVAPAAAQPTSAGGPGDVLTFVTGPAPTDGTIVSALPHGDGMRYRVVAGSPPAGTAEPVEPTLEDGYLALVQLGLALGSADRR